MKLKIKILLVLLVFFTLQGVAQKDTTKVDHGKPSKDTIVVNPEVLPLDSEDVKITDMETETTDTYAQTELPQIIAPSPQSKNFQIYGEYPVSYNTGVPDISIPLYTIQVGDMEVPIILRYHASGIKPKEPELSNIGAGWTLDVGGLVTRTIRGKADEIYKKRTPAILASEIDQENIDHLGYLAAIINGTAIDSQHDKFSFSFPGQFGNFAIEDDGTGNFTAYSYPFVPYKFDIKTGAPIKPENYKSITGIDITDDKGIKYKFGYSYKEIASFNSAEEAPTGWFLEEINNNSNSESILFTYDDIPYFSKTVESYSTTINDNAISLNGICSYAPTYAPLCLRSANSIHYNTKNIKNISFRDGHIAFTLSSSKKQIESFTVYNNNNKVIRSFVFNRDLFPNSSSFYRLNSLDVKDELNNTTETYGFTYHDINQPLEGYCSVDYWGYCNGSVSDLTPRCPRRLINIDEEYPNQGQSMWIGNADYTPDEDQMKRYVLEKIQYPTGGTSEFSYEANRYSDIQVKLGGGLRITKIVSVDGMGGSVVKTYEYEPGQLYYRVDNESFVTTTNYTVEYHCQSCVGQNCDLDEFQVYYLHRNRTFYDSWNSLLGDNRVNYSKITEYTGDNTTNTGKAVYTYSYENPDGYEIPEDFAIISEYRNWGNGLLTQKEIYSKTGTNEYTKMKLVKNQYEFTDIKWLHGLCAYTLNSYPNGGNPLSDYYARQDLCSYLNCSSFPTQFAAVNDVYTITGAYYLKSTEEKDYSGGESITVFTEYKHANQSNFYPSEISVTNSDMNKRITRMKYPQDFTDLISTTMVGKNMISPVIEQSTYNNYVFLNSTKTEYFNWGNNVIAPITIQTKQGTNNYEPRIRYHLYNNKGNAISVSKENDVIISYLWNYNQAYPVVELNRWSGNWTFVVILGC